jgi:hypothetical protein
MAQSDVYPEWSTLRADPLGAKVLFLALRNLGVLEIERNFEPWEDLRAKRAEYVLLGVTALALRETKSVENLVSAGGVALLALRPPPGKAGLRTEQLGFLQLRGDGGAVTLELRNEQWQCLIGERSGCLLAEKKIAKGRVWLLADGSALRNGELHGNRRTELLTRIFALGMPVIFDESHLGVDDTGGVGVLLRRYRLFPAIGMLLLAALLFAWRNSVSSLPEREPLNPAMTPQPAASLRTLLAQRIPRGKLLETLVAEWKRALPLLPLWQQGRAGEMDLALERARQIQDEKLREAELRAAVRLRKGAA